uniref:Retrotransposon protein, putative, unclassified n=2 Tax=Oryza sativa subsp. japonica TaxID=39947 RepID=Q2R7P2_ORYSJ|nr:retrotransposon protein, putative, unclassified [Oryza sativa Japonica Group]ABA92547.1 retrotransposon protein, putative, unclassified [Oryza sativa Japonica Group]
MTNNGYLYHLRTHDSPVTTVSPQVPPHIPNAYNDSTRRYPPDTKYGQYNYIAPQPQPIRPPNPPPNQNRLENMEELIGGIIRDKFGIEARNRAKVYQKPYPDYYDNIPYPRGYRVPEFTKFSGEDSRTTWEHVGYDLTLIKQKYNESVIIDYVKRFRDVRNQCYSLNITDRDLAHLAFNGLIAPIKERLYGQQFLDESWVNDSNKFVRPYEKKPNVNLVDYPEASDSDDEGDHDMYVAEWSWTNKKKAYFCSNLMPTPRKDRQSEIKYCFDVVKCDKIFDYLLQEKQIRLPKSHVISSQEELKRRAYCKWHDSHSHSTNDCNVFRQQVQSAIDEGRLKFTDGSKMKLDHDPFPVNTINFNDKKVLIRPEQAECTKEKGVVIGESRPKMMVPKNPEVGVWKENRSEASSSKAPKKAKVTFNMLLDKYEKQGGEKARNKGKRPRSSPKERFGHSPRWSKSPTYDCSQDMSWGPYPMPPPGYPFPYYMPWGATPPMFNHMPPMQYNRGLGGPRRPAHERLSSANNGRFYAKNRVNEGKREVQRAKVETRTSEVITIKVGSHDLPIPSGDKVGESSSNKSETGTNSSQSAGHIDGKLVSRMLVNGGAAVNLMPYSLLKKLGHGDDELKKTNMILNGFNGEPTEAKGIFSLELTAGNKTLPTAFFIVDVQEANLEWLQKRVQEYRSTKNDIGETIEDFDEVEKLGQGFTSADPLKEVDIGDGTKPRPTFVNKYMRADYKVKVIELLKEYIDCFAWEYHEMLGLSRDLVEHRLPIKPGFRPHKQPPRRFNPFLYDRVKEQIELLLKAGFVRPCRYAEWVSSIVLVEKKGSGKIRFCIDYRYLNKVTPKDEYTMPIADMMINDASGHKVISFLDGNVGYNQIFMAEEDMYKTAFRCPGFVGLFEWVVMTFGLKNAGATYQRAMNLIFHDLLCIILEIYIDDIVVESDGMEGHITDLKLAFETMRRYGLKMNPLKCALVCRRGSS